MNEGDLPKESKELVKEWMIQNQKELLEMWDNQKMNCHLCKQPFLAGGGL